jgi:hypothetical protein
VIEPNEVPHRWDDEWAGDDALLTALTGALRPGVGLIDEVATQGRGVYEWRTVDDDLLLAELSFDSQTHQGMALRETSTLREGGSGQSDSGEDEAAGPRVVVFEAAPLSIELEVTPERVIGQIVPPGPGRVSIETATSLTLQVTADEFGFFELPPLPPGPMRVRCDTETSRLRTDWITL